MRESGESYGIRGADAGARRRLVLAKTKKHIPGQPPADRTPVAPPPQIFVFVFPIVLVRVGHHLEEGSALRPSPSTRIHHTHTHMPDACVPLCTHTSSTPLHLRDARFRQLHGYVDACVDA